MAERGEERPEESAVFQRVLEAEPRVPGLLRRSFRAWLSAQHWPSDEADDLVMALNEAASNVVEHAYRSRRASEPRELRVVARTEADPHGERRVRLTVTDSGRWRPIPSDPGHRGRGLRVMRACNALLGVDPAPTGTRVTMLSRPCA